VTARFGNEATEGHPLSRAGRPKADGSVVCVRRGEACAKDRRTAGAMGFAPLDAWCYVLEESKKRSAARLNAARVWLTFPTSRWYQVTPTSQPSNL
jgi:hypothetical protein